jgi:cell division protein FtsB
MSELSREVREIAVLVEQQFGERQSALAMDKLADRIAALEAENARLTELNEKLTHDFNILNQDGARLDDRLRARDDRIAALEAENAKLRLEISVGNQSDGSVVEMLTKQVRERDEQIAKAQEAFEPFKKAADAVDFVQRQNSFPGYRYCFDEDGAIVVTYGDLDHAREVHASLSTPDSTGSGEDELIAEILNEPPEATEARLHAEGIDPDEAVALMRRMADEAKLRASSTPDSTGSGEEADAREWLIRKGGYYYRPRFCGYTTSPAEAGRYTKEEAEREAAVEPWHMKAVHENEATCAKNAHVASISIPESTRSRRQTCRPPKPLSPSITRRAASPWTS